MSKSNLPKPGKHFSFLILCAVFFTFYFLACVCAQQDFVYDTRGKRNPFIPLVTSNGMLMQLDKKEEFRPGDLLIEGIIYAKDGSSFAIVNGNVVGVGYYVDNYQVLKIEEDRVVFIKEGQTKEVELKKEEQ